MPQEINIHLGGEEGGLTAADWAFFHQGDVEVSYLPDGTTSGRSTVCIAARNSEGKLVGIELTGRNLMNVAGAIRGKMIQKGEIQVEVDPGLVLRADPDNHVVHFALEHPLQEWDFSANEAQKFWQALREFADIASRGGLPIGPTGEAPSSGIAGDEGGLAAAMGVDPKHKRIVMTFGKAVTFLVMRPDEARRWARSLIEFAAKAEYDNPEGTNR